MTSANMVAFQQKINTLLNERNQTMREASIAAGLNPGAISSYMTGSNVPSIDSCVRLGLHFGVNPNVLLRLAGHPPLPYFPDSSISEIESEMLHALKSLPEEDQLELLEMARLRAMKRGRSGPSASDAQAGTHRSSGNEAR